MNPPVVQTKTTAGSKRSYNSPEKGSWRAKVWKTIVAAHGGDRNDGVYLYLAGPDDNDREKATWLGIRNENLIAIDWSEDNVARIRERGGYAICGAAIDVLWNWPRTVPVAGVFLDFCSGIEKENVCSLDPLMTSAFVRAGIAMNFMRGRDAWWTPVRQLVERFCGENPKNRALQFLMLQALLSWTAIKQIASIEEINNSDGKTPIRLWHPQVGEESDALGWFVKSFYRPHLFSYKSGVLTFDSFVISNPIRTSLGMFGPIDHEFDAVRKKWRIESLGNRIAATLATRTRRIRSTRAA